MVHSLLHLPTREGHRVDLLRLRLHCTGTALGIVLVTDSRDSDSSDGALVQDGAGGRLAMDVRRTQRSVEAGEAGGEGDDDAVQHLRARQGKLVVERASGRGGSGTTPRNIHRKSLLCEYCSPNQARQKVRSSLGPY